MKQRQFLRLSIGEHYLTDGIYKYKLQKYVSHDLGKALVVYRIQELLSLNAFSMFVQLEDGKINLRATMSVGGLYIHSGDTSCIWYSLEFMA